MNLKSIYKSKRQWTKRFIQFNAKQTTTTTSTYAFETINAFDFRFRIFSLVNCKVKVLAKVLVKAGGNVNQAKTTDGATPLRVASFMKMLQQHNLNLVYLTSVSRNYSFQIN